MPRDANGVFTPKRNWRSDADNAVPFDPDKWDEQDADFAVGLTGIPTREELIAGNLDGGAKHDALAPPTANDDSANTSGNGIFKTGATWTDTATNERYALVDDTPTAAIWAVTTAIVGDYIRFFDTHTLAVSALSTLEESQVVEVAVDETRQNERTRYCNEAGVLVYKETMFGPSDVYSGPNTDFRGTSAGEQLALSVRKPRRIYAALFEAQSAIRPLRACNIGDSLSNAKGIHYWSALDRLFGGVSAAPPNITGLENGFIVSGGRDVELGSLVSATRLTGAFSDWPTGVVHDIQAGGSIGCTYGGVELNFEKVEIFFIKEPGAGVLGLEVGGVLVDSSNGNAVRGLGIVSHTQTLGQASVKITATGGPVKVIFGHHNRNQRGVDYYGQFGLPGLNIVSAMSSADARDIYQAALMHIDMDYISFEMDDDFVGGGSVGDAFELLQILLNSGVPYADKLVIGSTPRSALDVGKIASGEYLRQKVASQNASWLFFDSYHLMGTYADMVGIFGADDGTHPNKAAQAFAAEQLVGFLGLAAPTLGYAGQPVRALGAASTFQNGTKIVGGTGQEALKFQTDPIFGIDWDFTFNRSFAFKDEDGNTTAQFSNNVSGKPNILPAAVTFDDGGTKSRRLYTGSGLTFLRFDDSADDSGQSPIMAGMIKVGVYSRAQLLAIPANQLPGAITFCYDAVGGQTLVWSRATSPTAWISIRTGAGI